MLIKGVPTPEIQETAIDEMKTNMEMEIKMKMNMKMGRFCFVSGSTGGPKAIWFGQP